MALLQRFPREILDNVWSNLSSADLITTSRVSHDFNVLSAPFLYKKPNLSSHSSSRYLLLRTLLTPGRESLATHVKSLSVHWDDFDVETNDIPESDIALLTLGASRLGLGDPFASEGAQVILLLSLLPSLRVLSMHPIVEVDSFSLFMEDHHYQRPVMTLPLGFRSLRDFHWATADMERGLSVRILLTILSLPYIRTMSVQMGAPEMCDVIVPSPTIPTNSIRSSSVTHLTLYHGNISEWWIPGVLQIPQALTHLTLEQFWASNFRIPGLRSALEPLKSSLQLLHLGYSLVGRNVAFTNTIGSLRDWPVLRTLRIIPSALVLKTSSPGYFADVLPECIRDLEFLSDLGWTTKDMVPELLVLLEQKHKVPRLRTLGLLWGSRTRNKMIVKLDVACKEAEVELKETRFGFGDQW